MIRIAILGSTRGSSMEAIIQAIHEKKLAADITIVISNKQNAGLLERARSAKLTAQFVDPVGLTREEYDGLLTEILDKLQVDLIVLIGYMRILSGKFINHWQNKIINIHPSLLPDFAGLMDLHVHQAVLDAKKNETGCTVHVVTEEVDAGPILIQKKCKVLPTDTKESLKERVQALEGIALIEAIAQREHLTRLEA